MSKIIVIVGPTASGKTRLSLEIAKHLKAEIINADVMQTYKEVNIGTAKITQDEMEGITHHLINFNSLDKKYSIYDYQKDGRKLIDNLIEKNKNIVIVGGSGLYIKALLYDYDFQSESNKTSKYNNISNEDLKRLADRYYEKNEIHPNNRKRLLRFIEYYENTGKPIVNKKGKDLPVYDFKIIGLNAKREDLYLKIDARVEEMMMHGLIEEAKKLYEAGKDTSYIIGYKELNLYFESKISLEEAKEEIKKDTRRYAKRQYTWFKNQFKDINWIDVDFINQEKTIKKALDLVNNY